MYKKPTLRLVLTCGTLVLATGCHKKATVQVPLTLPAPQPEPVATIPQATPPPATPTPAVAPPVAVTPTLPSPPQTTPAKPSPFPSNASRPAPVTPIPAPSLGAILSADQKRKLDAEYQADIRQANGILTSTRGRTLSASQTDAVNRARAFIRQAAQYHDRDLATAAELARRARVLMQDLAGTH